MLGAFVVVTCVNMLTYVDPVQFWVVDGDCVVKEACLIFFHATAVLFEQRHDPFQAAK